MTVDNSSYQRERQYMLPDLGFVNLASAIGPCVQRDWYQTSREWLHTHPDLLFSIDTGSSTGNYNMGSPHPIAWYQDHGAAVDDVAHAGRSFFTSLGHTNETWTVRDLAPVGSRYA